MNQTLTRGNITKTMLLFALPMMAGNLLQQFYNITDTFIVGKFLGKDALAAVGSAYTLMTFLTSILLGLSMGNGVFAVSYTHLDVYKRQGAHLSDNRRNCRALYPHCWNSEIAKNENRIQHDVNDGSYCLKNHWNYHISYCLEDFFD